MIRDIHIQAENYLMEKIRSIHYLVQDLPRGDRRTRRGVLTQALSRLTGLATTDDLNNVIEVLEQIESGIMDAAQMQQMVLLERTDEPRLICPSICPPPLFLISVLRPRLIYVIHYSL